LPDIVRGIPQHSSHWSHAHCRFAVLPDLLQRILKIRRNYWLMVFAAHKTGGLPLLDIPERRRQNYGLRVT